MKHILCAILTALLLLSFAGCGTQTAAPAVTETSAAAETTATPTEAVLPALADGVYSAKFNTDSSMFHANETCNGRGTLTVENGVMTLHVSLASTSIQQLFLGLAEDAQKDGAVLLEHTEDSVTYPDGLTETVNGFDIPVAALDTEFDLALIGKKGVWYDHKVSVTDPLPLFPALADGTYTAEVSLLGGTGKTTAQSPCTLTVENGKITANLILSSTKYDYVKVNGVKYGCLSNEIGSAFAFPVTTLETPLIGDTVAMSEPHEIEYTLVFDAATLTAQ